MNNGKICISTCAETAHELIEQIRRAETSAEVVEVRFDCLVADEPLQTAERLPDISAEYLFTYRAREQGGKRDLSGAQRVNFWAEQNRPAGADLELDIIEHFARDHRKPLICSFHDFSATVPDIELIYERLKATGPDVVKVAVSVRDVAETIDLWKLLERAGTDGQPLIPIAMGEAGKSTRILGLARGAYMTYASLASGGETAPGQISAEDLVNLYRVKELNEATEVYGIVAGDTSYSVSPYMHNTAFRAARLNSVFVPLQVTNLAAFIERMVRPPTREIDLNFKGFSVTNPHKQSIIPHLDEIDDAARQIGAVNTVKIVDGRLQGYNTDADGFIQPLKKRYSGLAGAKAAVIGAGGAARACIYALLKEKADVTVFARNTGKASGLSSDFGVRVAELDHDGEMQFGDFNIVVNSTPVGTKGRSADEAIATAAQLIGVKLVYDLTYNPTETQLIREAKIAGAETVGGLDMLVRQGVRQFEIWTGLDAPVEGMRQAVGKRLGL